MNSPAYIKALELLCRIELHLMTSALTSPLESPEQADYFDALDLIRHMAFPAVHAEEEAQRNEQPKDELCRALDVAFAGILRHQAQMEAEQRVRGSIDLH